MSPIGLVFSLICTWVFFSLQQQATAIPFFGREDNCVISFVVPKEKMKTSCESDDKMNRRLVSVETKVSLCQQQMLELQTHMEKQSMSQADKVEQLARQNQGFVLRSEIEDKIRALEKEMEELRLFLSNPSVLLGNEPTTTDNTIEKMITENADYSVGFFKLAKLVVDANLKELVDNLTNKFENYIQEQILTYKKTVSLPKLLKNSDSHETFSVPMPEQNSVSSERFQDSSLFSTESIAERTQLFETLLGTYSTTNSITADLVETISKKDTIETEEEAISTTTTMSYFEIYRSRSPNISLETEQVSNKSVIEAGLGEFQYLNDSYEEILNFTYEVDDAENLTEYVSAVYISPTISIKDTTSVVPHLLEVTKQYEPESTDIIHLEVFVQGNITSLNVSEMTNSSLLKDVSGKINSDISKKATSRIKATEDPEKVDEVEEKNNAWHEGMIQDQSHKQADLDEKIKAEISSLMEPSFVEMISWVEKQKAGLEDKIKLQDEKFEGLYKDLLGQIKSIDSSVSAITLQLESISRGLEDSFTKLEKIKSLEIAVSEVKKGLSFDPVQVSGEDMKEQSKAKTGFERLVGIYRNSTEKYIEEAKQEYRELKEWVQKEIQGFKSMSRSLQKNLTSLLSSEIGQQNLTFGGKIQTIMDRLTMQDESLIMLQLDVGNVEKAVSSRSSKVSEKDLEKLQDDFNFLNSKQRDFKKRLDLFEQIQNNLTQQLNSTSAEVSTLRTEVKLSSDEWMPWKFEYDASRTDCFGDQYVRRSKYAKARMVGVILCSPKRYKIFLSPSLHGKFLNIGDGNGMGEDHCEFVGGSSRNSDIKLSTFKPTFGAVQGYVRSEWGEQPMISSLNAIKPSPHWYECNIEIP